MYSTDLNTWASAGTVVSSVNGTSGAFTQTNTASGIWGYFIWVNGTATTTPTGTPSITGWYLNSHDGGTTYETSAQIPPRAPDFNIAFPTVALTATSVFYSSPVRLWPNTVKFMVQNNTGVALTGTGQLLKCAVFGEQY